MTLWVYHHDYDTMEVPSYNDIKGGTVMTMILWGYSHDYKIMYGLPSPHGYDIMEGPHDYEMMGDPQDNEIKGGNLMTIILYGYPHDYNSIGVPS